MFQKIKNQVTLFLKLHLAILTYLNSVTMLSLSFTILNDKFFSLTCALFTLSVNISGLEGIEVHNYCRTFYFIYQRN
jgi:hypothetical protein